MGWVGLCWRSAPCKGDPGSQTGTKGGQSLMERWAHEHSKKKKKKKTQKKKTKNADVVHLKWICFTFQIKLERKKRGRDQHSDRRSWVAFMVCSQPHSPGWRGLLQGLPVNKGHFYWKKKINAEAFIFQLLRMGWFYAQSKALVNNSVIPGERVNWPLPFSISSIWGKERIR